MTHKTDNFSSSSSIEHQDTEESFLIPDKVTHQIKDKDEEEEN